MSGVSELTNGDGPASRTKTVAILGGGMSGLTSIKACLEQGFKVKCFEKQRTVGGLWRYRDEDEEGLASVMKSTIINSSKEMSAFSDFPPPTEFSNYMHNSKMVRYLELYAEHFDLSRHVLFRHDVIEVVQSKDYHSSGRWKVKIRELDTNNEFEETFDGVMICTGHHVFPNLPKMEGLNEFKGRVLHTHSYKRPTGFEDKKVVVVGVGNSGGDVAVELSAIADKVYLSTRRGCWILHRVGPNGLPFDAEYLRRTYNCLFSYLPFSLATWFSQWEIEKRFDHTVYNLRPEHSIFGQHPMVNDALPNRILSGTVEIKSNVSRFTPLGVVFEGEEDKVYECDTVVMATGYLAKIPYLGKDVFDSEDNKCDLYKWVFPPQLKHPSLCFIGMAQPVGPLFPISETQARWYAQLLKGSVSLPSEREMRADILSKQEAMALRYFGGPRHTIQIDWLPYMDEIGSLYNVKPNMAKLLVSDPKLFWACFWGPCLPYQYRLFGPHQWAGAKDAILKYNDRVLGAFNTRKTPKGEGQESRSVNGYVCFGLLVAVLAIFILALVT